MINIIDRHIHILSLAIIVALGILVYANSLNGKFVYDDEYLVKDNAYIKSLSRLPKIFYEDVGSGADRAYSFYRPVLILTYALDYSIWNVREFGYHLTSLVAHILAGLCVYWFIAVLFGSGLLALFASAIFIVHPIHVEAVSYISGRSDSLGLIFTLLTFIFYMKANAVNQAVSQSGCVRTRFFAVIARLRSSRSNLFKRWKILLRAGACTEPSECVSRDDSRFSIVTQPECQTGVVAETLSEAKGAKPAALPMGRQSVNCDRAEPLWAMAALTAYALALLSRENSLILPVLILAYHWIFRQRVKLRFFLPVLGLALTYILIRLTALKPILTKITYDTTVLQRLPGAFAAVFNYVKLLILPFGLRMEYGYIKPSWIDFRVIGGLAILVGSLFAAVMARNIYRHPEAAAEGSEPKELCPGPGSGDHFRAFARLQLAQDGASGALRLHQVISFSILWFFIALFPVLNIYPINAYMAEHWLYMPSVGFFVLVASGLLFLWEEKGLKLGVIAVLIAVTAFYSFLTIRQNDYWNDPVRFYERTLKYSPNNFGFYTNLGRVYASEGKGEKAIECYRKAIEIEPRFALPYNNIGNIYLEMGALDKAVPYYKKAIELDPGHAFTYNNLGNLYMRLEKYKEAIALYKKAVEMMPNNAYMYNNLGKAYFSEGSAGEAEAYFKKALDIDPNILFAYTNLAELYLTRGDHARAIEYLRKALKYDPANPGAYIGLAYAYYKLGDYPQALANFDKATSLGLVPSPDFAAEMDRIRNKL